MPGFILDTNHVQPLWQNNSKIMGKLGSFPKAGYYIRICSITLGELEAGHRMTTSTDRKRRDEFTAWVNATLLPSALDVRHTTRGPYADILGEVWRRHPPGRGVGTEQHLLQLGVNINDVWTAAVALEHGLTLVTQDQMAVIRKAAPQLACDCWL